MAWNLLLRVYLVLYSTQVLLSAPGPENSSRLMRYSEPPSNYACCQHSTYACYLLSIAVDSILTCSIVQNPQTRRSSLKFAVISHTFVLLQVVQECTGYCSAPKLAALPCQLLFWALSRLVPKTAALLLTPCTLQQAEYVLVKVLLRCMVALMPDGCMLAAART